MRNFSLMFKSDFYFETYFYQMTETNGEETIVLAQIAFWIPQKSELTID